MPGLDYGDQQKCHQFKYGLWKWDIVIADKLLEGILNNEIPEYNSNFLGKLFYFLSYAGTNCYVNQWFPRSTSIGLYILKLTNIVWKDSAVLYLMKRLEIKKFF